MTQDQVMKVLEDKYGAERKNGCATGIEFEVFGFWYTLPPPYAGQDACYGMIELQLILDVWNEDAIPDEVISLNGSSIH